MKKLYNYALTLLAAGLFCSASTFCRFGSSLLGGALVGTTIGVGLANAGNRSYERERYYNDRYDCESQLREYELRIRDYQSQLQNKDLRIRELKMQLKNEQRERDREYNRAMKSRIKNILPEDGQ